MPLRTRAALGGAMLAFAAAPAAAEAQRADPIAKFRVASVRVSDATITAGSTVTVRGRVQNGKGRRSGSARVTYTLRSSRTARSGRRLGGDNIGLTRAGRTRGFSQRLRIPASTRAGTYYLTVCVRTGSGVLRADCRRLRIRVSARRVTPPARPVTPPARPVTPPAPPTPPVTPPDTRTPSQKLRDAMTQAGLNRHLQAFQQISDDNGGNRASGFQGYGASVQYVINELRAAGYAPYTQVFSFVLFSELSAPVLARTAPTAETYADADFDTMSYSGSGDVTAPVTPVDVVLAPPRAPVTSGCEDADFAGFTAGHIALVQRGTCTFGEKAVNAQEAGASAVIIFNQGNDPSREGILNGTLGAPVTIPVVGTTFAVGEELAAGGTRARVRTETSNENRTSTNVFADTAGGNPNRVIVLGSHLDSVDEGPGINDNGTGTSANLEVAINMARLGIQPVNKVRFAFWGAEESGLIGSTYYVNNLSAADKAALAANINVDMLGSPNHARFVYDGDFSNSTPPATAPTVNEGAARIERMFVEYFTSQGLYTEPSAFDGRSDYEAFQDAGIPSGGLFSGAEGIKTEAQAAADKFGGTAGVAYDPNYHKPGDTIANVDMRGFEQLADGLAHVIATMATDPALRNAGGGAAAGHAAAEAGRSARATSQEWLGKHLVR